MARRTRARAAVGAFAAVAGALGATLGGVGSADRAEAGVTSYTLDRVGMFDSPVHVEAAPGAARLLFVVERAGVIEVRRDGEPVGHKFLDISGRVRSPASGGGNEEGLLSVAFDPGYEENRRFYVYYVNDEGNIEVDSYRRRAGSATRAKTRSRRLVIEIRHQQAENHNGGQLHFGPDGFLYLAPGDGGPQRDPEDDAQDRTSLLGKVLRIDPLTGGGYDVPGTNPYVGKRGRDEVFARGLRNPYRFSFDSATGDLTIGDVGGAEREEIDHETLADARGANFGWNDFEGFQQTSFGLPPTPERHEPPIHDYSHAGENCAVTGGYVVHDPGLPSLAGRYVYADFCAGDLRSLDPDAPSPPTTDAPLGVSMPFTSSFGEGAGAQIYVVSLGGEVAALEEAP